MLEMPFDDEVSYGTGRDVSPLVMPIDPMPVLTPIVPNEPIAYDTPAETGWSPNVPPPIFNPTVEPVDYWPVNSYEPAPVEPVPTFTPPPPIVPISIPAPNENMFEPFTGDTNCQCITYPCDCDGSGRIDSTPMPFDTIKPTPIIDPWTTPFDPAKGSPIVDPTPMPFEPVKTTGGRIDPLPYNVTSPPPVVTLNINSGTAAAGKAADASANEPMKILGLPWYYAAGIAAGALLLLSSMDGKK